MDLMDALVKEAKEYNPLGVWNKKKL
jgi:hypothetical protein